VSAAGPQGSLAGRRLIHVTTTDMSLAWLLGPQLRAFAAEGMEVIGMSAPGPFVSELEGWGIRHVALRHATRAVAVRHDLAALPELRRQFRRLRPDIVHTHNPKPGLYGRVAARLARVPHVVNTIHGLYAVPEDSLARRTVVYGLERVAAACSDAELLQNVEDVDVLRRIGVPSRKLTVLGNGVDLARFHPHHHPAAVSHARTELGLRSDAMVIGVIGRLVWEKGFRELFEAAQRMAGTDPSVTFVVVGPRDDSKGDALGEQDIAAAEAIGNVVFAGHRDDVEALYPGFDLYTLPSYREGFPRSAMEAAACGLPIVATDIRGCRQAVDDGVTGLLVPPHDADALTAALTELVRDQPRGAAMGVAARMKAEKEFDDREVVRRTLEVYRRLVADDATSRAS
jgi:glycosyltransferase involved in cell wall biosynthesis